MKTYIHFIGAILLSLSVVAQNKKIKGKVYDAKTNAPLIGATVTTSSKTTAVTDKEGIFTIECSDSLEIIVSYVSYNTLKQKVSDCNAQLNIALNASSINLNTVEITATSNSNKALLYQPVSIVKLNETEIKRGNGLFMDDAINGNVPGVFMERRTISAGQQFNIRGYGNGARGTNGVNSNFDGQGSKVYLNGIPITDAEGITLMDDIDFGSIGNVEVTKGPAGSLYGLAIAGVVNLETKKAEKGKISIGQDVLLGSYGLERYTSHVQIGGERSSLLVNYGKQKFSGYMPHTASHKDFVNIIGEFKPNEKQTINTYLGYSNSYDQRNGELTIGQYDTLDFSGNTRYIKNNAHSEVVSFRAGFGHTYLFNKYVSNTTSLFGTGLISNVSSAGGWTDKVPVNYGTRSAFNFKFSLSEKYNLSGIAGVEAQRQNAQIMGYGMVADSANLAGYNIVGAMRSNQYTISQTSSVFTEWTLAMPYEFSLTAGVGLASMGIELNDRLYNASNNKPVTLVPTKYETTYKGMVSPRIALNKVFSKQLSVYASYNKGYKAPVSSYFFIPTTGQVNTGLKAEIGNQIELGTKGTLMNNKLNYQLAVFNAIFSNKMTSVAVPDPAKTVTLYTYLVNGGKQNNKGVEAALKYTAYQSENSFFKLISPFANFCYSNFKYENFAFQKIGKNQAKKDSVITVDYSGNPVAGVPPVTVNLGFDIVTKAGVYANATYSYRDATPFTSDGANKTSAYNLVNAKIGYQQTFFKHLNVDAYFGANNITSTKYYYMVFLNQLPDAYIPAPNKINYFGGINVKYIF